MQARLCGPPARFFANEWERCIPTELLPLNENRVEWGTLKVFDAADYTARLEGIVWATRPRDPQSWNLYSYVTNNPLKFVDVQGRCTAPAVGKGQVGICIGLYISAKTVGGTVAGFGLGDARGPAANDKNATYRAEIHLVVDPAKGTVQKTKDDAGVSKAVGLVPPPTLFANKGTSDTQVTQSKDKEGNTHVNVENTAMNGLAALPGAPKDPIQTSLQLEVTPSGSVGVDGGLRTAYPSLEVFSYDSSGRATPILQIQETKPEDLKKQDQVVPEVKPKP